MQITDSDLKEFKRLYKKRFGKDISNQEALESATSLLNLVRTVYIPITKGDSTKLEERDKKVQ